MIAKERALDLLGQHLKTEALKKHCVATGAIMRALAQKFGVDTNEMEERLIELEQEGMIDRTGRHVALTEFGEFRTNGKNRAKIKPR